MAFVHSSTSQEEESYLTLKIFKSTFLLLAGVVLDRSRLSLDIPKARSVLSTFKIGVRTPLKAIAPMSSPLKLVVAVNLEDRESLPSPICDHLVAYSSLPMVRPADRVAAPDENT